MKGVVSRIVIIVGTLAVLAGLSLAPAFAVAVPGPALMVGNPNPGDVLPRGRLFFTGQAWDALALKGPGVDRVSVYSGGGRDNGGVWLGTAAKSVCIAMGGPGNNCPIIDGREQGAANFQGNSIGLSVPLNGWAIKSRVTLKRSHSGSFYFYARSSVSGAETVVKVDNISVDPGRALTVLP
jgi:hypothetical protein